MAGRDGEHGIRAVHRVARALVVLLVGAASVAVSAGPAAADGAGGAITDDSGIDYGVVVGDRRPYPTALIGIEPDTVSDWAQQQRIAFTTYRDLTEKKEVVALVQEIVTEVNSTLATVEQIKAFRLLPKLLEHEDGELTATQKVRRAAMAERFGDLVESMYRGGGAAR